MPEQDTQEGHPGENPRETSLPSDAPLEAVLEALLFACEEPLLLSDVTALLGPARAPEIERVLGALSGQYESDRRGLRIQRIAGGYRLTTDPRIAPFIREMVRSRNRKRLSRAALETLAIVAYKQPITAPEIQAIRGVNPSAILASLLDRRLIRILGRKRVVGKPFLYGTTQDFLVRFGLNSLGDLPSMEEFDHLIQTGTPDSISQETEPSEAVAASFELSDAPEAPEGDRQAGENNVSPERS
ncbi:MAG: SMC-Scp complex subunit ScpB [Acidobacteriota bacterium]